MGEAAAPDVPDIEPPSFDLIVIGTGFQESLLAGCASDTHSCSFYSLSLPTVACSV
jgi:hypothetical protein